MWGLWRSCGDRFTAAPTGVMLMAMRTPRLSATSAQALVVLAQIGVVVLLALLWRLGTGPVPPGRVDWPFVSLVMGTPALLVAASVFGAAVLARQPERRSVVRALALLSTASTSLLALPAVVLAVPFTLIAVAIEPIG